jgi:hypothetical protein
MKEWKRIALEEALDEAIAIEDSGNKVERFTDYHWRINGIDVWPSSKKYMKNGVVQHYKNLKDVL